MSAPALNRASVEPSRFRFGDVMRTGFSSLGNRRARTVLSALGIAIGIASLVGVLGLSESSKSDLLAELDALGTNFCKDLIDPMPGFRDQATGTGPLVGHLGIDLF